MSKPKEDNPNAAQAIVIGLDPATEDVVILFNRPLHDLMKICPPSTLTAEPIAPGLMLEKLKDTVAGVRLFKPVGGEQRYASLNLQEREQLERFLELINPVLARLTDAVGKLKAG